MAEGNGDKKSGVLLKDLALVAVAVDKLPAELDGSEVIKLGGFEVAFTEESCCAADKYGGENPS